MSDYKFSTYEPVLVRRNNMDASDQKWEAGFYNRKGDYGGHLTISCFGEWKECIPYKGNEHLLGTSEDTTKELEQFQKILVWNYNDVKQKAIFVGFIVRNLDMTSDEYKFLAIKKGDTDLSRWIHCEPYEWED